MHVKAYSPELGFNTTSPGCSLPFHVVRVSEETLKNCVPLITDYLTWKSGSLKRSYVAYGSQKFTGEGALIFSGDDLVVKTDTGMIWDAPPRVHSTQVEVVSFFGRLRRNIWHWSGHRQLSLCLVDLVEWFFFLFFSFPFFLICFTGVKMSFWDRMHGIKDTCYVWLLDRHDPVWLKRNVISLINKDTSHVKKATFTFLKDALVIKLLGKMYQGVWFLHHN